MMIIKRKRQEDIIQDFKAKNARFEEKNNSLHMMARANDDKDNDLLNYHEKIQIVDQIFQGFWNVVNHNDSSNDVKIVSKLIFEYSINNLTLKHSCTNCFLHYKTIDNLCSACYPGNVVNVTYYKSKILQSYYLSNDKVYKEMFTPASKHRLIYCINGVIETHMITRCLLLGTWLKQYNVYVPPSYMEVLVYVLMDGAEWSGSRQANGTNVRMIQCYPELELIISTTLFAFCDVAWLPFNLHSRVLEKYIFTSQIARPPFLLTQMLGLESFREFLKQGPNQKGKWNFLDLKSTTF